MTQKTIAPYGTWQSPIPTSMLASSAVRKAEPTQHNGSLYWLEGRATEMGRNALVQQRPDGSRHELVPQPFNARSRVHEYGGGSYLVTDYRVLFVNFADQRIYAAHDGKPPIPLTPESQYRYADMVWDDARERLICVREDHTQGGEPVNTLVSLKLDGADSGTVLAEGHDFFASARLSPDGSTLVWLTWNHPNMPWDGTDLWQAAINQDGSLAEPTHLAGGLTESIFQPEFASDGTLYFVSDRTNWWNIYRWQAEGAQAVCEKSAEFGLPQWVFGMRTYDFIDANTIACAYIEDGVVFLAKLDVQTGGLDVIEQPCSSLSYVTASAEKIAYLGGSETAFKALYTVSTATGAGQLIQATADTVLSAENISTPETIEFPTENGQTAYAFFYPPQNADVQGPAGELPPLIVFSHGGPTGATSNVLSLSIQYWTSRGFGIVDVNYGGSTGFGREYRDRLKGNWGVIDIDDCINAAQYLVQKGRVDGDRLAIRGGSAGGYTTLAALAFKDVFKAGASYFGISDLELLAQDTHKFESRYLDSLVGPYPAEIERYKARSPINFVDQINCPMILLQGLDDRVVPPNQAEVIFDALKYKEIPVAYVPFEGEGHGFRKAENIIASNEAELYFYGRVFGFEPHDIPAIEIENM